MTHYAHSATIIPKTGETPRKGGKGMKYETVKVVNGYEIYRAVGTHGFYYVNIREGNGWKEFHSFKTIKAAVKFCEIISK